MDVGADRDIGVASSIWFRVWGHYVHGTLGRSISKEIMEEPPFPPKRRYCRLVIIIIESMIGSV